MCECVCVHVPVYTMQLGCVGVRVHACVCVYVGVVRVITGVFFLKSMAKYSGIWQLLSVKHN